jgi:hypothetical protein
MGVLFYNLLTWKLVQEHFIQLLFCVLLDLKFGTPLMFNHVEGQLMVGMAITQIAFNIIINFK